MPPNVTRAILGTEYPQFSPPTDTQHCESDNQGILIRGVRYFCHLVTRS